MKTESGTEHPHEPRGKTWPRVTFAVLSWNRLHYLRATLSSAQACIQYPNLEWIVSDNQSDEPGLQDYLNSLEGIDRLLSKKQTHADAMNELVNIATGEYLFIWPEDVQFVVQGDWLKDIIELLEANQDIGSVGLDGIRTCTLADYFHAGRRTRLQRAKNDWRHFHTLRRARKLESSRGFILHTLGGATPGVCGSGIPTLTRTETWKTMGPWQTGKPGTSRLIDSSLGAEDNMVARFYATGLPLQMAIPYLPVAADIITDASGCKAKVRGPYRFGDYMPPLESPYYYRLRAMSEFEAAARKAPLSFFDVVDPIGFSIPTDARGDRLKSSLNTTIVHHIAEDRPVPHPLTDRNVTQRF